MTNAVSKLIISTSCPQHINDLPDCVLKHIFDRAPLEDVLHRVGRVCRAWREIQEWSCHNRRTLTLLIGHAARAKKLITKSTFYQDVSIHQEVLNHKRALIVALASAIFIKAENASPSSIKRMVEYTFPSITRLQVAIFVYEEAGLNALSTLMHHYGAQLSSLKLHSAFLCDLNQMLPILNTIGQLPKLDHLTLDLNNRFRNIIDPVTPFELPLRLPVLARLHEFCFYSEDPIILPIAILLQPYALANLNNLRRLDIHNSGLVDLNIELLMEADEAANRDTIAGIERILSKITCARWFVNVFSNNAFLSKLTGLKSLYFVLENVQYYPDNEPLFTTLEGLTSLAHLYISILEYTALPHLSLPLRSICLLKLKWIHTVHSNLLQLRHTFPQLHTLILRCIWMECNECFPPAEEFTYSPQKCWRILKRDVSRIYTLMPWLAQLDFKCYGEDIREAFEADERNPEPFLHCRLLYHRNR